MRIPFIIQEIKENFKSHNVKTFSFVTELFAFLGLEIRDGLSNYLKSLNLLDEFSIILKIWYHRTDSANYAKIIFVMLFSFSKEIEKRIHIFKFYSLHKFNFNSIYRAII